mmetsp:Transcript_109047/g.171901  ORF Transcript_109047/g.171901 Transcript_109047/m.171901 type:complete len:207 (-) Transcript_109047:457-1077(-)
MPLERPNYVPKQWPSERQCDNNRKKNNTNKADNRCRNRLSHECRIVDYRTLALFETLLTIAAQQDILSKAKHRLKKAKKRDDAGEDDADRHSNLKSFHEAFEPSPDESQLIEHERCCRIWQLSASSFLECIFHLYSKSDDCIDGLVQQCVQCFPDAVHDFDALNQDVSVTEQGQDEAYPDLRRKVKCSLGCERFEDLLTLLTDRQR